jgi:hypothetical protein
LGFPLQTAVEPQHREHHEGHEKQRKFSDCRVTARLDIEGVSPTVITAAQIRGGGSLHGAEDEVWGRLKTTSITFFIGIGYFSFQNNPLPFSAAADSDSHGRPSFRAAADS